MAKVIGVEDFEPDTQRTMLARLLYTHAQSITGSLSAGYLHFLDASCHATSQVFSKFPEGAVVRGRARHSDGVGALDRSGGVEGHDPHVGALLE